MKAEIKLAFVPPVKCCTEMKLGELGIVTKCKAIPGRGGVEFPTRGCWGDADEYHYRPLQPGDVIAISG